MNSITDLLNLEDANVIISDIQILLFRILSGPKPCHIQAN